MTWYWWRNYTFSTDGHCRPGKTWTCEKVVSRSLAERCNIVHEVRVVGKQYKSRPSKIRPYRWSGRLVFQSLSIETGGGSCQSVRDGMTRADRLDLSGPMQELLRLIYTGPRTDVYREEGEVWIPHCTDFGPSPKHREGRYLRINRVGRGILDVNMFGGQTYWAGPDTPQEPSSWSL